MENYKKEMKLNEYMYTELKKLTDDDLDRLHKSSYDSKMFGYQTIYFNLNDQKIKAFNIKTVNNDKYDELFFIKFVYYSDFDNKHGKLGEGSHYRIMGAYVYPKPETIENGINARRKDLTVEEAAPLSLGYEDKNKYLFVTVKDGKIRYFDNGGRPNNLKID